jgi:hypothetical protein
MMTVAQASGVVVGCGEAGATRVYVCPQRDQLFLMPVSMRDWLEEGHLAWFRARRRRRAGYRRSASSSWRVSRLPARARFPRAARRVTADGRRAVLAE